jgi:hypothetical protein
VLSEPGLLGYGGYACGKEEATASQFEVPEELEGHAFFLRTLADGKYELTSPGHGFIESRRVGVSRKYVHQNVYEKSDKAEKMPAFLNTSLPQLKQGL